MQLNNQINKHIIYNRTNKQLDSKTDRQMNNEMYISMELINKQTN